MWSEHLCLLRDEDHFYLATCRHETLGSIYQLIPEERLYDEDGELIVPKTYKGKRVVGLEDNEYLLSSSLWEESRSPSFDKNSLDAAENYCNEGSWSGEEGFASAWASLLRQVGKVRRAVKSP